VRSRHVRRLTATCGFLATPAQAAFVWLRIRSHELGLSAAPIPGTPIPGTPAPRHPGTPACRPRRREHRIPGHHSRGRAAPPAVPVSRPGTRFWHAAFWSPRTADARTGKGGPEAPPSASFPRSMWQSPPPVVGNSTSIFGGAPEGVAHGVGGASVTGVVRPAGSAGTPRSSGTRKRRLTPRRALSHPALLRQGRYRPRGDAAGRRARTPRPHARSSRPCGPRRTPPPPHR